jgi:nitrate/nitrite-specific signal transduction histidine kinase
LSSQLSQGHAIASRALRPLEQITARTERITATNLGDRLEVTNPHDELGNIARVFNHLLERLEHAFQQLQRFTADASHEYVHP